MSLEGKRALVTCGPTCVPIDEMRIISNQSTGKMGQLIAQQLKGEGADVTLLEGAVRDPLRDSRIKVKKFFFYSDLVDLLNQEVKKTYDLIIHAAAVSDYKLKTRFRGKMSSHYKTVTLNLIATKKLINEIKRWSPETFLVGFKLETSQQVTVLRKKAQGLMDLAQCDLVIANTLKDRYRGYLFNPEGRLLASAGSRIEMAKYLVKYLKETL